MKKQKMFGIMVIGMILVVGVIGFWSLPKTTLFKVQPPAFAKNQQPGQGLVKSLRSKSLAKVIANPAEQYLFSLIGDFQHLPEAEQLKPLLADPAHLEWMNRMESILGQELSAQEKSAIKEQHLQLLQARNQLQEEYLAGRISWESYVEGIKNLSSWDDGFYQRTLTDDQFQRLSGYTKEEAAELVESTWVSPETEEVFLFYDAIKEQYPEIQSTKDLEKWIEPQLIDLMVEKKKELLQSQVELEAKYLAGILSWEDYASLFELSQAEFERFLQEKLTEQQRQLFLGYSDNG